MKNVIKEIIIILLLVIVIALVIGVLLYNYIPTSKVVPVVEPYEIPEMIQNEISENVEDIENEAIITYEIDESDLEIYERGKDYQKGKINPFSQYSGEASGGQTPTTSGGNSTDTSKSVTTHTSTPPESEINTTSGLK